MALSSACKEAILMRRLINEIGCEDEKTPIILYGDFGTVNMFPYVLKLFFWLHSGDLPQPHTLKTI